MALLTTQQISSAGTTITMSAAAGGGDTADISNGRTYLRVANGGGGAITVTLDVVATADGDLAVPDRTVSVAAGGAKSIGPLNPAIYGATAAITYSGVSSVTVAAVSV